VSHGPAGARPRPRLGDGRCKRQRGPCGSVGLTEAEPRVHPRIRRGSHRPRSRPPRPRGRVIVRARSARVRARARPRPRLGDGRCKRQHRSVGLTDAEPRVHPRLGAPFCAGPRSRGLPAGGTHATMGACDTDSTATSSGEPAATPSSSMHAWPGFSAGSSAPWPGRSARGCSRWGSSRITCT